jgi:chromosome segregation ATPase
LQRHTNDLLTEKEEELAAEAEQVTVMEGYVEEMQSKVTRMAERETSTEAYIQDLEEKIRNMSVSSDTTSEALGSLQKEISKYKDVDSTNAGYILELERRLAKSEEVAHELRIATEKAGSLVETREGEIKELQQKLAYMRGDEQGWRFDLEAREDKLRAVEAELQQWQGKGVPFTSQKDKHGLEIPDGTETPTSKSDLSVNGDAPIVVNGSISEAQLEDKLRLLQEQHSATVAQLADVSTKYREALHEISDLAAQLKEYQLQESSVRATAPDVAVDGEIPVTTKRRPSASRKASEDLTGTSPVAAAKRNFFKAAASTDSLRARYVS